MKTKISFVSIFVGAWVFVGHVMMAEDYNLLTTFTNPSPDANDNFGIAMATVGTDRVIVGSYSHEAGAMYAGAAYLFNTNGNLLTTFTNPTPAPGDRFGRSITLLRNDRVLIGAYDDSTLGSSSGAAYLFSTNGSLLTTFNNPAPINFDSFGHSVATAGSDYLLIGAPGADISAEDAGVAYLFNTNGILVTTYTNPIPVVGDFFGVTVAAVGSDRVIVGAYSGDIGAKDAGAAYLFNTNGNLLTVFTNPTPAADDYFGWSLAAVGSNYVLIGAPLDDAGATDAGAAYLFNTDAKLITTFTNPTSTNGGFFGFSAGAFGSDRILIGAPGNNYDVASPGAVYIFNTNGSLVTTLNNPTPAGSDKFGWSLAASGIDCIVVGASLDDAGAANSGSAYLFTASATVTPTLAVTLTTTNTVVVSWPHPSTGFVLEQNFAIGTTNWASVTNAVSNNGSSNWVVVQLSMGNQFFRLKK